MEEDQNTAMQQYHSSSPSLLSSPPSAISEPGSPTRIINAARANIEMDEIIVDPGSAARFGIMQQQVQQQQASEYPPGTQLTAAGVPRKKPGRKPGSTVKPKVAPDGTVEPPKQRRPRKPKDPNAPPVQRKRKAALTESNETNSEMDARAASGPPSAAAARQPKITELTSMRMSLDGGAGFVQTPPKRESMTSMQMQNLLNSDEPPPQPQPTAPARQMFDPIRGNYDPIRESMVSRDPYGTGGPLGSPRAPAQAPNRASASPSIASLVDPPTSIISPRPTQSFTTTTSQPRFQEPSSVPASPANPVLATPATMPKPTLAEARRPPPPPPAPASVSKPEPKMNSFTSMSSIPSGSSLAAVAAPPAPVQSKKIAAVVQQETKANKKARSSTSSSPKINGVKEKDSLPPLPASERSILDFGRAKPGEEVEPPSIALHIPLKQGENNKYVNFMRMAEERYGWDALHPRLAASRERKALIAAATAALEKEKNGSGRDTGDEMEEDLSEADNSNVEMGGMGNGNPASGPEAAPAKPARKKRNFKEDEYDKDDDFVDDSEMLWEEQAAASRDGFFVYSGPLIPEVEKPVVPEGPPRRGRGGRGRGSRGGARGGGESGRGRGGGPGSRGGTVRKPRITKLEKEQRDREKAEREALAQMASKAGATTPGPAANTSPGGALNLLTLTPPAAGTGVTL